MKPNNDTPSIRFAGFTDAWEQRKLGDVAPLRGGYAFQSSHFRSEGIPIVKISNILQSGEVGGDFDYYDEISGDESFTLPDGAAVLAMSGATTGKVSILSNKEKMKIYQNQRVGYFSPREDVAYSFIQTITRSHLFTNQLKSVLVAGAQPNVSSKDIDNFEFYFPTSICEQARIGAFLTEIDNLITLHQRKYNQLVNIKKSMLEKMFPKNGDLVPEVRFAGFTDAWEQRRLGDVVDRVVRKNTNNESSLPLTISAQYGLVDQITYFNNRVASRDVSNYYLVLNGEFAYNKSSSDGFPFGTIKRLDLYDMGVLSTLYIVFSIKDADLLNSDFLTVYFDTNRWHKGVSERAAEGARNHGLLNISAEDFLDIDITIPSDEKEQAAIGSLFEEIDRLITLHQRKLERLQNIKKACLEKMFV